MTEPTLQPDAAAADSVGLPSRPWPLRISTLGTFRVLAADMPLQMGRKVQRRALDLLKAIVALGGGTARRDALVEALWPDSAGDVGRDAFEITLHRLRKLLGRDDAIIQQHGQLHLNEQLVWVDVPAFDRLVAEIDRGPAEGRAGAARFRTCVHRAMTLYAGAFLQPEEEQSWILPARARLRSRYVRLARRAAEAGERSGDVSRAVEILQRALEHEPVAEALHRELIRVLADTGRRSEAIEAYRWCRQLLASVLGVRPAADTEAIYARLTSP